MLDVVFKIESWILEGAVVVATLLIAYATYKFARGETEKSLRYFLSGLAAILLGFYGWNVLISTFPPITGLPGSSLLYYALIGACFVSAVVYFAVGRFERGVFKSCKICWCKIWNSYFFWHYRFAYFFISFGN